MIDGEAAASRDEGREWESLRSELVQFAKSLAPAVHQIRTASQDLAKYVGRVQETIDQLPSLQAQALKHLASDGWYLDPGIQARSLFEIAAVLASGDVANARSALIRHFKGRVTQIEADITGEFPERAIPIRAALAAHKGGKYELSIPVFLAQADGICNELYGVQLYAGRGQRLAEKFKEQPQTELMSSLLYPLVGSAPMTAPAGQRASLHEPILNRHAILHGEDSAYGTEINSCRALSHLNFVAWILRKRKGEAPPIKSPS